jgi:hypothetical protein
MSKLNITDLAYKAGPRPSHEDVVFTHDSRALAMYLLYLLEQILVLL